jgi:3',5'-cyclic AMP phosphodiesterase CpdA
MMFNYTIKRKGLKRALILPAIITLLLVSASCGSSRPDFTFVFMTDIHIQQEKKAVDGFSKAIENANNLNPGFVITGGDLVMDALGATYEKADMLYNLYLETSEKFNMPVYNTPGNHEIFGLYEKSGVDPSHPEYGKKMFAKRIGKPYYSFDYKGWHFLILDSIGEVERERYRGIISEEQVDWIKADLKNVAQNTPIVLSAHIPFITSMSQVYSGSLTANSDNIVIVNSKEVLELFNEHNLKLVLQGHLHFFEDIYVQGVHFITAGSICGKWWEGPNKKTEEGFLLIKVKGEKFEWEYIDYGWSPPFEWEYIDYGWSPPSG